jgi:hypothetical protein
VSVSWPSAERLRRLPANHRRVVGAALGSIVEHLPALVEAGVVALDRAGLRDVRALTEAVGGRRPRNLEAVRVALLVQAEDLAPRRLAAYGPLTAEECDVLEGLAAALRRALAPPRADHGEGKA